MDLLKNESDKPVRKAILLASYCGDLDSECTEDFPCDDCLKMCNVIEIPENTKLNVLGGFEYLKELNKGK